MLSNFMKELGAVEQVFGGIEAVFMNLLHRCGLYLTGGFEVKSFGG
jgi:hypothetical protein